MDNQPEICFDSIILSHLRPARDNKSRINSRYSISYDESVIDIYESQIDDDLELQFEEITQAIRNSHAGDLIFGAMKAIQLPPSNTIEIEIEIEPEPEQLQLFNPKPEPIHNIPQIRPSNNSSISPQILTVMIILTSPHQISHIKISSINSKENEEITNCRRYTRYNNTHITVCIVDVFFYDLKNLVVKYRQVAKTYLLFSSKMEKEVTMTDARVYENVGIVFPVGEEEQDIDLINYCILFAQEQLSLNIKYLNSINKKAIPHFYFLFSKYFKPHHSTINQVFTAYNLSKQSIYNTEFFLYFIYSVYRENAINKLHEFDLIPKLQLHRSCFKILATKYFELFDNGQCFKQFIFYIYLIVVTTKYKQERERIREVGKYNIIHQNHLQGKRVLILLESMDEKLLKITNSRRVNEKMVNNKEISFVEYLNWKLKGLRVLQKEAVDNQHINDNIIIFLSDLIEKMKVNPPPKEADLSRYSLIISQIFLHKGQLRFKDKLFSEFYAKLKFLHRCSPLIGELFLESIRAQLYTQIPSLLRSSYQSIIHPLTLKPQTPQQNKLLLDFFQREKITTEQFIFLIKIWVQMKIELYNYLTIEYVLLKFVAINSHFLQVDLEQVTLVFEDYLREELPATRRKSIITFCERMGSEMKAHSGRQDFQNWVAYLTN